MSTSPLLLMDFGEKGKTVGDRKDSLTSPQGLFLGPHSILYGNIWILLKISRLERQKQRGKKHSKG